MNAEVKTLILPLLMGAGMVSPDSVEVIDLSKLYIDNGGRLVVPPDFIKHLMRMRPHLFRAPDDRITGAGKLKYFEMPGSNDNSLRNGPSY